MVLAVTGLIELLIAIVTGSVGLLGDAFHNLSDLSTSLVVFPGFRVSRKAATERYPYGFDRAEDLAGIGIAIVVWASAVFAGVESVHKLVHHGVTNHLGLGMVATVLGCRKLERSNAVAEHGAAVKPVARSRANRTKLGH